MIGTALAVLVGAAVAMAAINTYSAQMKFSPTKAGTGKKPVPVSFSVAYQAKGTNGNRTAPLTDVKSTVYGLKANWKGFPTCSEAQIAAAKNDTGCPSGALVASGAITAVIGPTNNQSASAPGTAPCDPLLHVWNSGGGKLTFFFVDEPPNHMCAGGALTTGSVPPYPATIKASGKNLVLDTPVPTYVSYPLYGIEGSLETLNLTFKKLSVRSHGKKVYDIQSVGCHGSKRPYSVTFTANEPNSPSETDTVRGATKCNK